MRREKNGIITSCSTDKIFVQQKENELREPYMTAGGEEVHSFGPEWHTFR